MPQWPAMRLFQNVSMSLPSEETTPSPVTTTRRSVRFPLMKQTGQLALKPAAAAPEKPSSRLLLLLFDVFDHIAHTLQFFRFFIGDFLAELLLQGHDQFNRVERIRPQVLDKLRVGCHLVGVHTELLGDDSLHSL